MEYITSAQPEQTLRYAVYSVQNRMSDGLVYTRSFIVVKNGYNIIVRFTRLQEYAGIYAHGTYRPITANPEAKLYFICGFLNYVMVEHVNEFGIHHIYDITKKVMESYFTHYALEKQVDGSYRSKETVERCVLTVTDFMRRLSVKHGGFMKISKDELFEEQTRMTRRGQLVKKQIPAFQVVGVPITDRPLRDMPTKVLEILLSMAFRYTEDIAFGLCLQAFAGLRAGEVCNVRQESSPLGAGIRFTEAGGNTIKAEIDLRREVALRSDNAKTGKIKKERLQCVYQAFLRTFMQAYEMHKKYLCRIHYEKEYAPMFVNQYGKAMSYETYRNRFKKLIRDHLRPYLAASGDPEQRVYGQLLYENEIGTHILRHWFTVQLVLRGEDIGDIEYWRGDTSPESAYLYLQNKGELVKELKETGDRLLDTLLLAGGELYGGKQHMFS